MTRSLGEKAQQLVLSRDSALDLFDQRQKLVTILSARIGSVLGDRKMGTAVTRSLGEKAQQLVLTLDSALDAFDRKQKLGKDTEAKAREIWYALRGAASRCAGLVAPEPVVTPSTVPQSEVQTALNAAMRRLGNHRDVVEAGVDALALWERVQPALHYDRDCREQLPQIESDLLTGDPASVKRGRDTLRLIVGGIEQQIAARSSALRDLENAVRSASAAVESSAQELGRLQSKRRSSTVVWALVSMIPCLPIGCGQALLRLVVLASGERSVPWADDTMLAVVVFTAFFAVAGGTLAFVVRSFSVAAGKRKLLEAQQEHDRLAAMLSQAQTEHRVLEESFQEGRR